jgi:hypothetical protein
VARLIDKLLRQIAERNRNAEERGYIALAPREWLEVRRVIERQTRALADIQNHAKLMAGSSEGGPEHVWYATRAGSVLQPED